LQDKVTVGIVVDMVVVSMVVMRIVFQGMFVWTVIVPTVIEVEIARLRMVVSMTMGLR